MATLARLAALGAIEAIEVELAPHEQQNRLFYGSPYFQKWLHETLPSLGYGGHGRASPLEQVESLLYRYIIGERLLYGPELHELEPLQHDIWELKTADVRIFGWFVRCDIFVATNAGDATMIKDLGLYGGFRDEAARFRDNLDLDLPKYMIGASYDNVLSDKA